MNTAVKTVKPYTFGEEVCNSITHGVGVLFGITMLSVLVTLSAVYGNVWSIVSCTVFGISMIFMYAASTSYHCVRNEKVKKTLKKLDHIAIYYLIAGTYTPFLLVLMRGPLGWTLFGIIWGLALLGTVLKVYSTGSGTKPWSISLYLGMGWLIVVASGRLFEIIPATALVFLVLGGLFYTFGVFFYIWKSKKYTHAVWHCFVLLGSLMHSFAILFSCVFVG